MAEVTRDTLSEQRKDLCDSHVCPKCGTSDYITSEQVFSAGKMVTHCHCRACQHSWHASHSR